MLPDVPIYRSDEYHSLALDDQRRWHSTIRAADCWWLDGQPEAIRRRLLDEIEFNDRFAAWRVRMLSNDLSTATDWDTASRRRSWVELERLRSYVPEVT
jgi:hypothetical protein